jgi:hypothetical protein
MLRYLFGRVNDRWYLSLFEFGGELVKGEITPAYAILNPGDVEHIQVLAPKVKIIYLLRNPIERAWSQVRFRFSHRNHRPGLEDLERVKKLLAKRGLFRRGDYLKTLETWRACFSAEQFFIGFFDDIRENPGELARSLFSFLSVDAESPLDEVLLRQRANAAMEMEMPPEVRVLLEQNFRPEIEELASLLGGRAARWKADLEKEETR